MDQHQAHATHQDAGSLHRALGLFALTAFGVGDILGAGVYGLVGRIAGTVGNGAWLSYVLAGIAAALTGLTYAEFTSRYPRAGGAAHFCQEAFRNSFVTFMVMYCVVMSGLFSIAMTSRVFVNYAVAGFGGGGGAFQYYIGPMLFVLFLALVAVRGIVFSSATNLVCALIEFSGLLLIIVVAMKFWGKVDYLEFTPSDKAIPLLVLSGATVAFFAFIGFEDMANLAEEVKNPERNVPLAICLAIGITGFIYCLIAVGAVSVLSPSILHKSEKPLIDVVRTAVPAFPAWIFSVIPFFAVLNTGLLNLLMASRLMYGMASRENRTLPKLFAYVDPRWKSPIFGIAVAVVIVVAMLAWTRDVERLSGGTTTFLLLIFTLLHVGLLVVKARLRSIRAPFQIPRVVPIAGIIICLALLSQRSADSLLMASLLGLCGVGLFTIARLSRKTA